MVENVIAVELKRKVILSNFIILAAPQKLFKLNMLLTRDFSRHIITKTLLHIEF